MVILVLKQFKCIDGLIGKDGIMSKISLRKRGSAWEYRFQISIINGKQQYVSKGGFRTKKSAADAGAIAQQEYQTHGVAPQHGTMKYAEYLDFWLDSYCRVNLKDTTCETYAKRIDFFLKPALGNMELKELTPLIIQNYLNGLFNQGYSRNTLVVVKGLLSGSLSYAVLPAGLLVHNPVSAVKLPKSRAKPKIPSRKKERIPITLEQWQTLMQRFPRAHPSHIALNLGYHLGLRLGEAFGLMWEDVDFKKGTVSIRRQVQYDQQAKAWELTAPKYESFRTISVDDVLLALLKDEFQRQQRAKEYFRERYQQICVDDRGYLGSVGKPVHLVNTRENGTFIQPRALQHTSRVIHKELNMPLFDFHSLRHTHTTLLLEAGANPLDVQERLGHSRLAITWQYAHNTDVIRHQTHKILSTIYNSFTPL